jgi:hypothetical protein
MGRALYDLEAETSVLGAVMLDPDAMPKAVAMGLEAADFYREPNGAVYASAARLHAAGQPIDYVTLAHELEDRGELERVGRAHLAWLIEATPTAANVEHYARIVADCAARRTELEEHRRAVEAAGLRVVSAEDGREPVPGMTTKPERRARTLTELEAEIIARATESVSTHAGHWYAPASEDFPGGVIVAGRDEPAVLYPWAPRVTRRVLMHDTAGEAAPVVYTVALPDGRPLDVTATEVRKGEAWDKAGVPVNTKRHQGLMGDIVALEAAKLAPVMGTQRLGWHTLPDGCLVYVRADGRCWPPELTGRIEPFDLSPGLAEAARPPVEVPPVDEQLAIVRGLCEIGTGSGRALPLLEMARGLRSLGASLHSPHSTVLLEARNDAGKTGVAMFARGIMFGRAYPPVPPTSTFRATANRIPVDLAGESDSPALIDDFTAAMQEDPLKSRQAVEAVEAVLRMQSEGTEAKGRLTKDSRKMAGYRAHTFPGITAEQFPRGLFGSSIRRMVLYHWEPGELPISVDGRYDPDTEGTLAWHYRRSWPTLRALGDAVIALLHGLGEAGARELLADRDTQWTAVVTGDLRAAGAEVTNMAQRAGPIVTGAELAERVLGLEAETLTGPARAALVPHLARQGGLYVQANAASADLAQQLGATVREALLAGRAHLASQANSVDATAFPSLTAQSAGYRELTQAGSTFWDPSSGRNVRLWGVDGEWVGCELAMLHALLRTSREDWCSRFGVEGLGAALVEAGAVIRSTQADSAATWRTRIGGQLRRIVRIPWSLVYAPTCEEDGPGTAGTAGTPGTPGGDSSSAGPVGPVPAAGPQPEQAGTAAASSARPAAAPAVPAVPGVPGVPAGDASPMQPHARTHEAGEDPRPDLEDDAELWRAVLAVPVTPAVRGALLGARASGAKLARQPSPDGRPRLHMEPRIGPEAFTDGAEWEAFRADWLLPHAEAITAALGAAALRLAPVAPAPPAARTRGVAKTRGAPADPAAVIAALGPDGRLHGRAELERVEVGPGMLRDALEATARAGGRQLALAGRPSEWLAMPGAPERRRATSQAAGLREWPALEAAKAAGWSFTTYDPGTGARVPGVGAWTDARHPEHVAANRWITLHAPEIEPTVRAVLDLEAGELHRAEQLASRSLGRRYQEWEGRGFRELVKLHRPNADAILTAAELPPPSEQETDPTWDREVSPVEWAAGRLWVFDRSGSYLSGLGVAVGSGALERLDTAAATAAAGAKSLRPGSWRVRLTGPDPLTARGLPPVLDRASGESWVPAPTLRLLRDRGASYEMLGAVLWPAAGENWWRPVAERLTAARDELLAQSDPAARVALELVKATYTKGIQMLAREAGEAGQAWHRPDVHAAIVQQCRANLLRAVGKARVRPVAYVLKDSCAWLVDAETPEQAAEIIGIRYGRRPGLWHEVGSWPAEEVRAAMSAPGRGAESRAAAIVAERRGRAASAGVARSLASVVSELLRRSRRDG